MAATHWTRSWPGFPPPRLETRRNPDRPATFGTTVAQWHLLIQRQQMMPHQRYVVDVAGELDPATGLRWYDTVLVKMPRQNAKTTTLEPQMVGASRRRDPAGRKVRRTVIYTAQTRDLARERLITDLVDTKLVDHPALRGQFSVRRSNGSEKITWRDTQSRLMVQAPNDTAGHGLTVDDVYLDEAFHYTDLTIVNAFQPTMITRPDPQLWIVSTPGDGTDALMLHYEELAAIAVNDPDTRLCVFDWSADEDDDRADPKVWRRVMPALGRTITEDRVRSLLATTPPAEFDRAYLARRPALALVAAFPPAAWADCANTTDVPLDPAGPLVLAVDVDPERTHGVLAVSFRHGEAVGAITLRRPGTRWIVGAVLELVNRHGVTVFEVWGDRRAGVGGIIDQLRGRGLPVHEVSAGDVASACGDLYDLLAAGEFVHDDQAELTDAVPGSRRRPLGEAWALDKLNSTSDVAPLNAVALAVAGFRHHFPTGTAGAGGIR